jgi:hypothetical protein
MKVAGVKTIPLCVPLDTALSVHIEHFVPSCRTLHRLLV